jgi:hypothetical protein
MSIVIAAGLSTQANLLALLQAKADSQNLNITFAPSSVSLGTPASAAKTDSEGKTYNTSIVVTAQPGSGFINSTTAYYNRLAVAEAVLAPQSSYTLQDSADNDTVIALVESALQLVPGEISLSGDVVRPADGSSLTLFVKAQQNSLLYTEEEFQITLTWERDLNTLFDTPYLDGFVTADDPESSAEFESTGEIASS